jgi:hypothetical protein
MGHGTRDDVAGPTTRRPRGPSIRLQGENWTIPQVFQVSKSRLFRTKKGSCDAIEHSVYEVRRTIVDGQVHAL